MHTRLNTPETINNPAALKAHREAVLKRMKILIDSCETRAELIALFNAYQAAKHDPEVSSATTYHNFGKIKDQTLNPLKILMCDTRSDSKHTRYEDHYNNQTFATTGSDSEVIRLMQEKRDGLEALYAERGHRREEINDHNLRDFQRKPWYTSNFFFMCAAIAPISAPIALLVMAGKGISSLVSSMFQSPRSTAATTAASSTPMLAVARGELGAATASATPVVA